MNCSFRNLLCVVIFLSPVPAWAEVLVHDWSLVTAVQNLALDSEPPQDVSTFEVVENPFLNSHSAVLGLGTATTSYDFLWSGDNASFHIDAAEVVPDLGAAFYCGFSQGSMNFTVSSDVVAHLTGAYTYSLPVPGMETIFGLSITDLQPPYPAMFDGGQADTFTSPSGSGSFLLDASMVLQAGHNYLLQYSASISAGGNSGALASGNGFFHVTFEPVPEPAMLGLFGLTAIGIHRRNGSGCR